MRSSALWLRVAGDEGPVGLSSEALGPEGGDPVLLLRGFPLDRSMWNPLALAWAEAGARVLLPDLRGHGRSPVAGGPSLMEKMAGDVVALADRRGWDRFLLGGFSMGGYVALELARRWPHRVTGLLLVDTRAEADTEEGRRARARLIDQVRARGMDAAAEAMVPRFFTPQTLAQARSVVDDVRRVILSNPAEGAIAALEGMKARADQRVHLPSFPRPVLVLVGEHDTVTPPEAARTMAGLFPNAELEAIPEAAHLAPLERPGRVVRVVLRWWRRERDALRFSV